LHLHRLDNLARALSRVTDILIEGIGIIDLVCDPEPVIRPAIENTLS